MWTVKEFDGKWYAWNPDTKQKKGKGWPTRQEALTYAKTLSNAEGAGKAKLVPGKIPASPIQIPNPLIGQLPPGMGGPPMPGMGGPGVPPGRPGM